MPRPRTVLFLLACTLGGLGAGWWILQARLEERRPVTGPATLGSPEAELGERFDRVRLLLSQGVDLHLSPFYRPYSDPIGGVGLVSTYSLSLKEQGPPLTFLLHLGMDPTPFPPVPVDAEEEAQRREATILRHLHAAGFHLLVRGGDGERIFMTPSATGWEARGTRTVLDIEGRHELGLVLHEALGDDPGSRTRIPREMKEAGAQVTFLIAPRGSRPDYPRGAFDFVLFPSPPKDAHFPDLTHLRIQGGARLIRVLELALSSDARLPRSLRPWTDLDAGRSDLELLLEEARNAPGGPTKSRALEWAWRRALEDLEELRDDAFYRVQPSSTRGTLEESDPGRELERRHYATDQEIYGPVVEASTRPHRSPEHPGSSTCQACHAEIHALWSRTKHARAFRSLESLGADRSPACIQCHTTGFDPSGERGWNTMAELRGHENVGCTSCHQVAETPSRPAHPWTRETSCMPCHAYRWDTFFHEEVMVPTVSCTSLMARAAEAVGVHPRAAPSP